MIRVIAGKYRTRKLDQPPLEITRPTPDRVREAVFSSIQFNIENALVLDLFSGSGANAIEAVSRGAMKAFAIDNNKKAVEVIKNNIETLKINNIIVSQSDVLSFLGSKVGTKFDFIFMDPPYKNKDLYIQTLEIINKSKLLKPNGLILCETDNPREITIPEGFVIQKEKKYGKAYILAIANNI